MTPSWEVTRVVPLSDDVAPAQALRLAAALASQVTHPIAAAIAAHAQRVGAVPQARPGAAVGKDGVIIGSTQALGVRHHPGDGVAGQVRTAHSGPHLSHRVLLGTASWVLHELGLGAAAVETTAATTGIAPRLDPALSASLANALAEAEREGATTVVVAWNGSPQAVLLISASSGHP